MHVFFFCNSVKSFWNTVEIVIRNICCKDFVFSPQYAVYNFRIKGKNTNDINLLINYALFSIYKAVILHIRNKNATHNILKHYLSLLLLHRIEVEKNKCKTNKEINIDLWKRILVLL